MPTASGQYQLQDYIVELQHRGFDGFGTQDLTTYINRGYFHVARRSQWYWSETTDAFTLTPGAATVPLWPAPSGELPNFRSLDKLTVTTAGQQRKLKAMSDDEFFSKWLWLDLTSTVNQGEPDSYYIYQGKLYVLRPPNVSRNFLAYYHQRVSSLVNPTDVPITPIHLDEAILLATLIRCHKRAQEPSLGQQAEADLEEIFDDMRDDEEMLMGEQPSRVSKDDTWL